MNRITIREVCSDDELKWVTDKHKGRKSDDVIAVLDNVSIRYQHMFKLPFKADEVHGSFDVSYNSLRSFDNFPTWINKEIDASHNQIRSLVGIHKIVTNASEINLRGNPIEEGGIGLLLINNLQKVWFARFGEIENNDPAHLAFFIITKHLGQGKKNLLACQEELIEAELDRFAIL